MNDETIHTLVVSSNRGRYALDHPTEGADISCGYPLAILLNGQWIEGRVEHSNSYPVSDGMYSMTGVGECIGYYFLAKDGTICGLCVGMRVQSRR